MRDKCYPNSSYRDNTQKLTNNSVGVICKIVMYKIVEKQAEILEILNCKSGERRLKHSICSY